MLHALKALAQHYQVFIIAACAAHGALAQRPTPCWPDPAPASIQLASPAAIPQPQAPHLQCAWCNQHGPGACPITKAPRHPVCSVAAPYAVAITRAARVQSPSSGPGCTCGCADAPAMHHLLSGRLGYACSGDNARGGHTHAKPQAERPWPCMRRPWGGPETTMALRATALAARAPAGARRRAPP